MGIIWTIIIGFVAGLIAKFLHPGTQYEPQGFILTTLLGIAGAFVATYLGQAIGWYKAGESAGLIGAVVGAIIVLVVWGFFLNVGGPHGSGYRPAQIRFALPTPNRNRRIAYAYFILGRAT